MVSPSRALALFFFSLRRSCRFVLDGHERRARRGACIEVLWHEDTLAYSALLPREVPIVAHFDPSLYTVSWEVWARRSSKTDPLVRGASTYLALDGPVGPARKMKWAALRRAVGSGRPIIPIRVKYSQAIELPTWDRRRLPAPGSTVTISFLDPLEVGDESAVAESLARVLG